MPVKSSRLRLVPIIVLLSDSDADPRAVKKHIAISTVRRNIFVGLGGRILKGSEGVLRTTAAFSRSNSRWLALPPEGANNLTTPSPISRTGKNEARISLMLARLLAILRVMSDAFRTVAVIRSTLSARRDLLLEILALRHQLGVLARSDRRFRPSDRLLWVCLRRLWPR